MNPTPLPEQLPQAVVLPDAHTLVLANRPIRRGTDMEKLSRFGKDRWTMTPGLFEEHASAVCIDFSQTPEPLRHPVKLLTWLMVNYEGPFHAAFRSSRARPAIRSVVAVARFLKVFADWLHAHGITALGQVTDHHLTEYAIDVKNAPVSHNQREDMLSAVLWAWMLRDLMPDDQRLPQPPPWEGERIADILGQTRQDHENRTPRIHPDTMIALLAWCLRFVEEFADDIIAAFDEYRSLSNRWPATAPGTKRRPRNTLPALVDALLEDYRTRGLPLPGRRHPNGQLIVNTYHLSLRVGAQLSQRLGQVAADSGLPIADDTYLHASLRAELDGQPWLPTPITYDQAPTLARHLSTAAAVLIGYLSGQRPGEMLNLERGCIRHDPGTGLILLRGKHYKNVRDTAGAKLPQGEVRADPWVVTAPVAAAVAVLERLHDARLLFPNTLLVNGRSRAASLHERVGRARGDSLVNEDIGKLIAWINAYCAARGRQDTIPGDPNHPSIYLGRLRRTLAWFIVRRPRGLIAAAIQYGHARVKMTLGYSGTYASGFPDDLVFEEWLARLEGLSLAHERLQSGEHVSGPAADAYRERVHDSARFAGRVVRTAREAATMLANPELQIFPGRGMTCVLDPARAACRLGGDERGTRRTPDIDDCRPSCANIARTDRDIAALRDQAEHLQTLVDDPLAPRIRHAREQHELDRLRRIIAAHNPTEPLA